MKKIEILAPAGSYESLEAAVLAGADAVYVGGNKFGARAFANNFSEEQMLEAIDFVHLHDRKIYMTVNTLLKEKEIENELYQYIEPYYMQGLDAEMTAHPNPVRLLHPAPACNTAQYTDTVHFQFLFLLKAYSQSGAGCSNRTGFGCAVISAAAFPGFAYSCKHADDCDKCAWSKISRGAGGGAGCHFQGTPA